MSYVLYLHPALCGTPNWYKSGKAITPYSAVRLRQRHMYQQFSIPYLWFGNPHHISYLETQVQAHFNNPTNGLTNQELVHGSEQEIVDWINQTIQNQGLEVVELSLDQPYSATKSSQCPFGFPPERDIHLWAIGEIQRVFYSGKEQQFAPKPAHSAESMFSQLFSIE